MFVDHMMSNAVASIAAALTTEIVEKTAEQSPKNAENQNPGKNYFMRPNKPAADTNPYKQAGNFLSELKDSESLIEPISDYHAKSMKELIEEKVDQHQLDPGFHVDSHLVLPTTIIEGPHEKSIAETIKENANIHRLEKGAPVQKKVVNVDPFSEAIAYWNHMIKKTQEEVKESEAVKHDWTA